MEDQEIIETLEALLTKNSEKEILDPKERDAIRAALSFMMLAAHTSDQMRKTLKRKHDANLRDLKS